jgi:hypothetical protein
MFESAKKEWIPELVALWQTVFGDDREYIELYYQYHFSEEEVFVWREQEKIVAMLHVIKGEYWGKKENVIEKSPINYIYACATEEQFRNKGIFKKMLDEVTKKELSLLVPSEEAQGYYERLGWYLAVPYKKKVVSERIEAQSYKKVNLKFEMTTPKEYKRIRDLRLGKEGYIEWDETSISCAMETCLYGGGYVQTFFIKEEKHVMMANIQNEVLVIIEITISDEQWMKYGLMIANHFGCHSMMQKELKIMSCYHGWGQIPYLNLALNE